MDEVFEKNGFSKFKDVSKIVSINIRNANYDFIFETNVINKIPNTDIEFAITVDENNKIYFFINKDFNPLHDETITSPYRTFYEGLMKEPFKFVYPLDEPIRIETDSNIILEVQIKRNMFDYLYTSSEYLKNTYKTKEQLIEQEKNEHYNYLKDMTYCLFKSEDVDSYLENLNNCNTWEEIESVYNKRPLNREIR